MSTSMPQVPPRPTRAPKETSTASASLAHDMPKIPPRPAGRRIDRSISPGHESFARSPLNETPYQSNKNKAHLGSNGQGEVSQSDLPPRPPSVVLPSIGQEGSEYAEVFSKPEELGTSPTQTRNVANDLKLHAPKPSLPTQSAKQRVSTVTRTDSSQAAAFGIGKAASDDKDPSTRPLKAKASFASQKSEVSHGTERPPSSADSEHGIPEIGQRVPMYPHAGDVQAPSPSPYAQPFTPGIGFHNDGSKPRHHGRKHSAREHDVPLEAYGRHGHHVLPHQHDHFEKAYYEKHPELFKKELGQYGEGRPEWAMSSDDLNKIVRDTASRGAGLGTSPAVMGTPSEQIGFEASEEYASRISSPRIASTGSYHQKAHSNSSQTHVESPLRKASFPTEISGEGGFDKNTLGRSHQAPSDLALEESEVEDDDVIHVDPARRASKINGGAGHLESTEDLGPTAENDGIHDEHHYSAPILASDEVAKEPFGYELQPAVSPLNSRTSYHEDGGFYQHKSDSQTSLSNSRPSSRPASIHGGLAGFRLPSDNAKLADLEEYEPLFPEDEKHAAKERPLTAADRLKRPELKNRKFPSQDIWEDSPDSVHHTATVSTPQLPVETEESKEAASKETAAQAFARRQEELAEKEANEKDSFLHKEKKPWEHKAHLLTETRPGLQQRFPSRDIWEDTPDSLQLQTTVDRPQSPDKDALNPEQQEKVAASLPSGGGDGQEPTDAVPISKPSIPARPTKSKLSESPEKAQPVVPERPRKTADSNPPAPTKAKPVIPARPSKALARESSESIPLSKVNSNSSAKSVSSDTSAAVASKPKPPVPTRPMGSKIAAMQTGFMADLNKRLGLGAPTVKKEEPAPEQVEEVKEKAPLADARKGRARGPARRAPAAKSSSPSTAPTTSEPAKPTLALAFSVPTTLWQIDPDKDLLHVSGDKDILEVVPDTKAAKSETPTLATNTAGESLHDKSEIAEGAGNASSLPSKFGDSASEELEEVQKAAVITESKDENSESEPTKPSDEPPVVPKDSLAVPNAEEEDEDMAGSTGTLKASEEKATEPIVE